MTARQLLGEIGRDLRWFDLATGEWIKGCAIGRAPRQLKGRRPSWRVRRVPCDCSQAIASPR